LRIRPITFSRHFIGSSSQIIVSPKPYVAISKTGREGKQKAHFVAIHSYSPSLIGEGAPVNNAVPHTQLRKIFA
jgi:hypothetical protein